MDANHETRLGLEAIREKINAIDDEMILLYRERLALCDQVAAYKKSTGKPILDKSREDAVIRRLTDGMDQDTTEAVTGLYRKIFEISRTRQQEKIIAINPFFEKIAAHARSGMTAEFPKNVPVACQGVDGAYSSIACKLLFESPAAMYFESFESVFKSVSAGLCSYGVLPFENSIYGSVSEVYEMLSRFNGYVVRSIKLPIHHALLAKPGTTMSEIREIYSHRQAIGQCSRFLSEHKNMKVHICENTAMAAKYVSESKETGVAAICSETCAEKYGLSVLKSDLQNSSVNYTMFYCIAKEPEIYPDVNKIAFMFNIKNEAGSLEGVLSRFASAGVNLTKIESRPIPGMDFEFMFYAEADTDGLSDKMLSLFSGLSAELDFFKFIGAYREIIVPENGLSG